MFQLIIYTCDCILYLHTERHLYIYIYIHVTQQDGGYLTMSFQPQLVCSKKVLHYHVKITFKTTSTIESFYSEFCVVVIRIIYLGTTSCALFAMR